MKNKGDPISTRWREQAAHPGTLDAAAVDLFKRAHGPAYANSDEVPADLLIRARAGLRRRVAADERRKRMWLTLPAAVVALTVGPLALAALMGDGLADWTTQVPAQAMRWVRSVGRHARASLPASQAPSPAAAPQASTIDELPAPVVRQVLPQEAQALPEPPPVVAPVPPQAVRRLKGSVALTQKTQPLSQPAPELSASPPSEAVPAEVASDVVISRPEDQRPRAEEPREEWAVLDPRLRKPAGAPPADRVGQAPFPKVEPSSVEREAALMSQALERLHRAHDPRGALALLDQHREQFPQGVLGQEAALTRLGALLELPDRDGAMGLLDSLSRTGYAGSVRAPELQVLHAELLAERGRCSEAVVLFDHGLHSLQTLPSTARSGAAIMERVLFGRGSCRSRLGELEGSRTDFKDYLQAYPQGRFAPAARLALGGGAR